MARDPSAAENQVGQRIGKYEILTHIATGGMGAVYRARDTESGQEVALKVLTQEMASKPAMLERFRREARSASKLSHENIVRVFDFGEANGTMFIAMEFVEGIDLHEHIEQKGKLDPEESRQIMIQAARALAHAAANGIVHRDIKPSNFLLTKKHGRILVKLTDMGLAREQDNEQFRVTRAGTTVGTVDYIAPEQARDSGVADERSDLYSLGCTWFHMLAGQPPFAKGGLAERLVKHMETPPPDIRTFNPKVSDALVAVLGKLLAKRPDDRYQSAQQLVQALQELNPTRKPASKIDTVSDMDGEARKKPRSGTPRKKKGRSTINDHPRPKKGSSSRWMAVAGVALLVLVGGVAAFLLSSQPTTPPEDNHQVQVDPNKDRNRDGITPKDHPRPKDGVPPRDGVPPKDGTPPKDGPQPKDGTTKDGGRPTPVTPPKFAALYKPNLPINVTALTEEFRKPWQENARPPADADVVRVSRSPDGKPGWYPTVEAALRAAPPGKALVVEIYDNGPLYEPALRFEGRSLVLRPGKGFRPLLVWDLLLEKEMAARPRAFLSLEKGSLWVDDLEIVTTWPEGYPSNHDALFNVRDGDVSLRNTTFSLAGKHQGFTLLQLAGTDRVRGRFERVYGRGENLAMLNLDAPKAEIGVDGCLFVGGNEPLVTVATGNGRMMQWWAARSTFIGRKTLVVAVTPEEELAPGLRFHWWDCLLTRMGPDVHGEMLRLPVGAKLANITWQATNCLYAGWPYLIVGGPRSLTPNSMPDWLALWSRTEGDVVRPNPWPAPSVGELENKPATTFRTAETPLCFAASSDADRPLGAPLDQLPKNHDGWQALTTEPYPLPLVSYPTGNPPTVPNPGDGLYHGEALDLTANVDLGLHLARQRKLGPRVVMVLRGSGEKATSPINIPAGTTLVLYADPPTGTDAPLTLRFVVRGTTEVPALIRTEGGGLELANLDIKPPEGTFARCPPYLFRVRGGDLKLFRCRAHTPVAGLAGFKTLLMMEGSGQPDAPHTLAVTECVFTTGGNGLRVAGTGALIGIQGSVIVSAGPVLEFEPGASVGPRVGVAASLEGSTFAARGPTLVVAATTTTEPVREPLVIQSRNCAFLHPFETKTPTTLLNARGSILAAGLLLWQSDGDVIDGRITRRVVSGEDTPTAPAATPQRTWGSASVRKVTIVPGLKATLDSKSWANLEPLVLPARLPGVGDRRPGADLIGIGAIKKKRP